MSPRDIELMARTVYGEARGEDWAGKVAVAHVIKNRAEKGGWWGDTIEAVTLCPWQFSCWNVKDPNYKKIINVKTNDAVFKECLAVAAAVLAGLETDPTLGSFHYHTNQVRPKWSAGKKPATQIGGHRFYNNIS